MGVYISISLTRRSCRVDAFWIFWLLNNFFFHGHIAVLLFRLCLICDRKKVALSWKGEKSDRMDEKSNRCVMWSELCFTLRWRKWQKLKKAQLYTFMQRRVYGQNIENFKSLQKQHQQPLHHRVNIRSELMKNFHEFSLFDILYNVDSAFFTRGNILFRQSNSPHPPTAFECCHDWSIKKESYREREKHFFTSTLAGIKIY